MRPHRIVRVSPLPEYCLRVEFDDGVSGIINLSGELTGPLFAALREEGLFAQVSIDNFGAVSWPNGLDLAPDAMYDEIASEAAKHSRSERIPGATVAPRPSR